MSIHTRLETPLSKFNNFVYAAADRLLVVPLMRVHRPKLVVMDILMDRYIDKRYRKVISGKVAIPVGIEPDHLRGGDGRRAREHLAIGDKRMILSVGHVIPQRSRIALAQALPAILERFDDVVVVVVGGVYHDEFLTVARSLGVDHAILTPGALPASSIPDYLAAADVEVHELEGLGFGTASLEALAVGVPVVAVVEPRNFIDVVMVDGRELYIAPPMSGRDPRADPVGLAAVLIRVLEDTQAARAAVSDPAQRFIEEHFTIDQVAAKHLRVLSELAGVVPD